MQSEHTAGVGAIVAPPTLFMLHFLGGSARQWGAVAEHLGARAACRPLDLPGFGEAAGAEGGFGVSAMADAVADAVRAAPPGRWFLAGHSMGAKVALAVARRAENGENGLEGLAGLILVAGSPPAPEPMAESRRADMLGWFRGGAAERQRQAARYVDNNAARLDAPARALAVRDVLRADGDAWRAWLAAGSREDWRERIGVLETPAIVLAGADDADLGEAAQRELMAPHFRRCRVESLAGARHLLPIEAPERVAARIAMMLDAPDSTIPPGYEAMLRGEHTAARLREGLLARAAPDDPAYRPAALDDAGLAALRALLAQLLPLPDGDAIDLAARIDRALAAGEGDGWRHDALPPDVAAFGAALRTLDAASGDGGFAALPAARRNALAAQLAAGTLGAGGAGLLDAGRMALWFADLRSAALRLYVSHPAALARMGYSGTASGGDGPVLRGFERMGVGARDAWEPVAGDAGA